jgi:hypothetical protein
MAGSAESRMAGSAESRLAWSSVRMPCVQRPCGRTLRAKRARVLLLLLLLLLLRSLAWRTRRRLPVRLWWASVPRRGSRSIVMRGSAEWTVCERQAYALLMWKRAIWGRAA